MKKDICEICGKVIKPYSKRRLSGAIRVITRAQDVCVECKEKVDRTDWDAVVRKEILKNTAAGTDTSSVSLAADSFSSRRSLEGNDKQKRA